jgi:hypothetical protein
MFSAISPIQIVQRKLDNFEEDTECNNIKMTL